MTPVEAVTVCGKLSHPSKMPCPGYSLPAGRCRVGKTLSENPLNVCYYCYAKKGRYRFSRCQKTMYTRYKSLKRKKWVEAISTLINKKCAKAELFRWHDSGDLVSEDHLRKIFEVCRKTPAITHWLPTMDLPIVRSVTRTEAVPDNLVIRLSSPRLNKPRIIQGNFSGCFSAVVDSRDSIPVQYKKNCHICRATETHTRCIDNNCRACWSRDVKLVVYMKH